MPSADSKIEVEAGDVEDAATAIIAVESLRKSRCGVQEQLAARCLWSRDVSYAVIDMEKWLVG